MTAALALFLALLLTISAAHKVIDRRGLAPVAAKLAGAPGAVGAPLLLAAATIEALAALMILAAPQPWLGAGLAAALWFAYALPLLRLRGEKLDCGCDFTRRAKPVDAFAIARPMLLALLAIALAASGERFAPTIETPFAALALLALWFAAAELAALRAFSRSAASRSLT